MATTDAAPALRGEAPDTLALVGDLRAAGVGPVLATLPVGPATYQVDLTELGRVDSAGVALIVEWQLRQERAGGGLTLINPPERLVRLAGIGGVGRLLGLETHKPGNTNA